MNTLNVALKEWDLVVSDLLAGRQAILLRKGGILEAENEFALEHHRFLFWPTYVHQDPAMTKPERRRELKRAATEPGEVMIRGYGEVAKIFEVPREGGRAKVDRLFDMHLWDVPLIDMRFAYRAEKPLYVVVVRAYRLPEAVRVENTAEYAGCKSWVPLGREIDVSGAEPAMADDNFTAILERVRSTLTT